MTKENVPAFSFICEILPRMQSKHAGIFLRTSGILQGAANQYCAIIFDL